MAGERDERVALRFGHKHLFRKRKTERTNHPFPLPLLRFVNSIQRNITWQKGAVRSAHRTEGHKLWGSYASNEVASLDHHDRRTNKKVGVKQIVSKDQIVVPKPHLCVCVCVWREAKKVQYMETKGVFMEGLVEAMCSYRKKKNRPTTGGEKQGSIILQRQSEREKENQGTPTLFFLSLHASSGKSRK